jgi:hypothetical protein
VSTGILLILNGHSRQQVKRRGFPRVSISCTWGAILWRFGVNPV